jgi:signal transduction histidine kinase
MDDYTSQIPTAQRLIEREAELSSQRQPDLDALQRVRAELDHTKELLHDEVAARQRAEYELRKAKDITTATLQAREDFLAAMSHELRTPLSIVIGYTDLLKDGEFGDLTEQQGAILNRVKKNAGDLLALIEALLDASRLQLGRASASVIKVRFGEVLEAVWEETKGLRESSPLQFIYDVQDAEAVFYTDVDKFKVILRNLINNARKFTERGQVTLRARRGGGGVEVHIIDTGIGIVAEEIPFIFVPFRKVGTALTRNKSGTGLGLYVVKSFVELLRGTITVESEIGRGSTFRVWLPMALR